MSEPSREAYTFAGFLIAVAVLTSYLRIPEASAIVAFAIGAASFIIGYRMGLPVQPEKA